MQAAKQKMTPVKLALIALTFLRVASCFTSPDSNNRLQRQQQGQRAAHRRTQLFQGMLSSADRAACVTCPRL
jgi:hypothetical protein